MEAKKKAKKIFEKMKLDEGFFSSGRRNDDAVNLCCVAKVLGISPVLVYDELFDYHYNNNTIRPKNYITTCFNIGYEHVERVIPYSDKWYVIAGDDIIEDYGILSASYMQVEE